MSEIEKLKEALRTFKNLHSMAEALGVSRSTLRRRLIECGLAYSRPMKPKERPREPVKPIVRADVSELPMGVVK